MLFSLEDHGNETITTFFSFSCCQSLLSDYLPKQGQSAQMMMMYRIHISLLLTAIIFNQTFSHLVYLENCTYSIDLYKEHLNLLWSSNDSRTLHIQAVYSLSSKNSSFPGQIYTFSSRSVALIPFFVHCQSLINQSYLPFTQCSSAITNKLAKTNYESTRTNLHLQTILSMNDVPLLYLGEYQLILSNCSFRSNSIVYQSTEIFSVRIEYETPILSDCSSCNRRTSVCYANSCRCRSGTRPLTLYPNKQFCVDVTRNCTFDSPRCFYAQSFEKNSSTELIFLLIVLISFILVLLLSLLWCLYRNFGNEHDLNQSIGRHQRTPSTISTIDSIKLTVENQYPKIIGEEDNGDIVYILV